jgi:hypothetical protein
VPQKFTGILDKQSASFSESLALAHSSVTNTESTFLQNVELLPDYTALNPRRQNSSVTTVKTSNPTYLKGEHLNCPPLFKTILKRDDNNII